MDYRNQISGCSEVNSRIRKYISVVEDRRSPFDLIVGPLAISSSTYQREHQNRRRFRSHTIPSIVGPFVGPTCECTEHEPPHPPPDSDRSWCFMYLRVAPLPVSLARSLCSFVLEAFFLCLSLVISHMTTNTYGGSHRVANRTLRTYHSVYHHPQGEVCFLFLQPATSTFDVE
jgi:hypothetical protein